MARIAPLGAAAVAALALAACSDAPVSPVASSSAPTVSPSVAASKPEQVMPGEVIVKLRAGVDAAAVAKSHGLAYGYAGYKGAFHVLRGAVGSERALAAKLGSDARVEYAEPNYLRQPTTDGRLWAFYNPGGLNMKFTSGRSSGQPLGASYASVSDADEDNVANYAATGAAVVIGSIDTGVQLDHPEFTGRLIAGKDWYNNDNDPSDDDGHGTHTTGTMAGTNVGVAGVAGAAPHVSVYVQKVCGKRGCPTTAMVNAIRAAADYGVVAMNLSIGGSSEAQSEADAIAYAVSKNALVIASAGNDGTGTVSFPAADVNAIAVAATQWQDKLASYSNWGPGLDISAPGGNCYSNTTPEGCIYSAIWKGSREVDASAGPISGATYGWMQGTSMAAPQVTGTAAVVASVTGLRGSALRTRILSTADDLGAAGADNTYGAGRLNTYRAVTNSSLPAGQ